MSEAFYVPLLISTGLNLITALFATKPTQKAPEPNLRVPKSDYGSPLPRIYGKVRIEGNKFWPDTKDRMYRVETSTETQGGKGFGGGQKVETKTVYGTFAILFSQGQCDLERLIVNGRQIEVGHNYFQTYCTWFDGTQTSPWSEIVARDESPYNNIAYKGVNYLAVKDLPLEEYGNQIPQQISAVITDAEFGVQPTLDLVVGDICDRAGVDSSIIDVTELNSIVLRDGLVVPESGDGYRKTLEDLMGFYLFTACETREGIIKFKKFDRGNFTPIEIEPQNYFPVGDGGVDNQLFVKTTEPKQTLPNKISVTFNNINQNWDNDEIIEYFEEFTKENNVSLSPQLTSYPYEVKERARLILRHLFLQQRNNYTFSLPGTYLNSLELLDLIELPNGEIVQIHQLNLSADFKLDITAKYYGGGINYSYSPNESENNKTPPVLSDPTQNIPNIYILDIPQIEDYPPNTLYICATGLCTVQASVDGGANYSKTVYHQAVSSIANIISPLANGTGLDVVNSFDIEIESGNFDSISQQEFDSGQGLGLVARQVNGYWEGELIKFRNVQILSTTQRRISYIARGQYNTIYTATQTKFFLLKSSNAYYSVIQGNADLIGQSILFRPVVANWQNLATTPIVAVTPKGNAYKPPAPTNLTGIIDEDGNIQLFWEYSSSFSPYDNSQENVTFEISINGIRTLTSDVKDVLYLVSDRTIDNLTPPLNVTVWAVSSVVGKGSPLIDSVNPTLIPDSILGTGGGVGLRGITLIYGNYTVQESDNKKAIIGIAQTSFVEYVITFPVTLSNGFECYVVNSLEGNGLGNRNSFFTIQGVTFLTRTHNNRIKAGESRLFVHVSEGRYFTLGKNDIIYDYQSLTTSGTAFVNVMWGIDATGISLSLPNNPIEGAFVGFRANPNLDFTANPVILSGNGKLIEGITSYTFKRNDERTIFFFTGEQWFYVTQYWYVDVEQRLINSLVAGNNVNIEVTGEGENTAITISAASSINIQDEENDVGSRAVLNFSGSGISASDDAINEKIDIVINDSYYLSRSNHSGTQSHSTISDFGEAVNDRVATLLTEGDNITLVYDDVANTLTINTPTEDIQDRVSQLLVAGNNISIVYNDVANTLTINTPTEDIQDRVASFLIAGNNVTLDYDDTANTLTVNTPTEDIQDRVSEFLVAGENISIFYNDESNSLTISSTAGVGGGLNHEIVNTSFVAVANTIYSVVANSSIICTLPPSPTEGDKVIIVDGDGNNYNSPTGFGLHTCTILGNGNTIQGQSNIVLNTENSSVELIYSGTRWNYVSRNYNFSNEHFYEVIDDRVSSLLVSGSNISLDYSDVANTLTVSVSGLATVATTGNYDDLTNKPIIPSGEFIDDRVASLLTAGSNITLNYNDTANTLTISANTDTLPVSVSNTYTLQSSDNKKWIKANGTFTISMPSSPPNYYEAIIQNVGTGIITIGGIVNAVGTKLTTRWTACHVYYDGSSWTAVGALTV